MLASSSLALLAAASATPCESLRSVSLSQTTIVKAEVVQAGVFVPPPQPTPPAPAGARQGGPAGARQGGAPPPPPEPIPRHCRMTIVLKPSSDSNINV